MADAAHIIPAPVATLFSVKWFFINYMRYPGETTYVAAPDVTEGARVAGFVVL